MVWTPIIIGGCLALAGLIVAEIVGRRRWGLGAPVLYQADPEIEYLLRPSQEIRRLGNWVRINRWHMRSQELTQRRVSPDELRVLVLGDSIAFGGDHIDQTDLASEQLRAGLAAATGRPVVVANASAGSWGPPNWLAYVRRFGFFDADVVLVVLSTHDAADVPDFSNPPVGHWHRPVRRPVLALEEMGWRLWPTLRRQLRRLRGGKRVKITPAEHERRMEWALRDLATLLREARATGAQTLVLHHRERSEVEGRPSAMRRREAAALTELFATEHVPVTDLAPLLADALELGQPIYRDILHLLRQGQQLLAKAMLKEILLGLEQRGGDVGAADAAAAVAGGSTSRSTTPGHDAAEPD